MNNKQRAPRDSLLVLYGNNIELFTLSDLRLRLPSVELFPSGNPPLDPLRFVRFTLSARPP